MNLHQISRLIVRLQGFTFLLYTIIYATYLPQYFRAFNTIHVSHDLDAIATQNFGTAMLRTTVYLLVALVLLGRTEQCIQFLAGMVEPRIQNASREDLKF